MHSRQYKVVKLKLCCTGCHILWYLSRLHYAAPDAATAYFLNTL